jgi:hypothetical protein
MAGTPGVDDARVDRSDVIDVDLQTAAGVRQPVRQENVG